MGKPRSLEEALIHFWPSRSRLRLNAAWMEASDEEEKCSPRYGLETVPFMAIQKGVLKPFAVLPQSSIDTRMLTADLLIKSGEVTQAVTLYQFILQQPNLTPQQKQFVARQLKVLSSR